MEFIFTPSPPLTTTVGPAGSILCREHGPSPDFFLCDWFFWHFDAAWYYEYAFPPLPPPSPPSALPPRPPVVWGPPATDDDRFRETACQTISTFVDYGEDVQVKGYAPEPDVAHFTQQFPGHNIPANASLHPAPGALERDVPETDFPSYSEWDPSYCIRDVSSTETYRSLLLPSDNSTGVIVTNNLPSGHSHPSRRRRRATRRHTDVDRRNKETQTSCKVPGVLLALGVLRSAAFSRSSTVPTRSVGTSDVEVCPVSGHLHRDDKAFQALRSSLGSLPCGVAAELDGSVSTFDDEEQRYLDEAVGGDYYGYDCGYDDGFDADDYYYEPYG